MKRHVVVIGAGYAGLTAALRVSNRHHVTLIDSKSRFTERIRLHEVAAGHTNASVPLGDLVAGRDIETVTAHITSIAPDYHAVHLHDGTVITYDVLVYALGSRTDTTKVPGARDHTYTVERAVELSRRLAAGTGTVAVVGGGHTGVELAAELAESAHSWRVRLVTAREPGAGLSERGRRHVARSLDRLGVRVHPHTRVTGVDRHGLATDCGAIPADVTVWAASFTVSPLAAEAGLAVDSRGRALVDAALRSTSHPDVFVVGDAARVVAPGVGELRMACATAMPTGAHAAGVIDALARGKEPKPFRFRYLALSVSLGRGDGVVQPVRTDDAPHGWVLTGRLAALVNEWINRYTLMSLRWEQRRPGSYHWAKPLPGTEREEAGSEHDLGSAGPAGGSARAVLRAVPGGGSGGVHHPIAAPRGAGSR
ncbi:NAD(P)/FAD-dependent oxidoreductase [Streptomyces sp. CBMA152]|uniref:NAD(P)/FAD-dependent oxidoreductase n=1 Tax=Streptomyces sp. CBMA152 TaxID=1896312 RepID=UPI00166077CB|nr:FAD-dependent oxidoreductase [Streptomyces sp. CBMA152]MBD0741201.1 hypothetical protein [Streptomyces sp. CBMA152]